MMNTEKKILGVIEKALQINLDPSIYGTIAEIGAGQEVARNFFIAGGAAGTIAKTMSAYDMQVSDAIYGQESDKRYVTYSRVQKMIDREYNLVVERLEKHRSQKTTYFAFANTISAKSYYKEQDCHGWIGIKFQTEPLSEPSIIVLHVRMKDNSNFEQQQALGILGINLIYGAFYYKDHPEFLIESLLDNLTKERIEIDMIRFAGNRFKNTDNRLMALHLVESGLTHSVFFDSKGEPIQANDLLYKKDLLVLRGSFRPFTLLHQDIFNSARAQVIQNETVEPDNLILLPEISMSHLMDFGNLDKSDFLGRVDTLNQMGFPVQITDCVQFYQLQSQLKQFAINNIFIVLGIKNIYEIFNESNYSDLNGGMIEGLGRLFSGETHIFVYPKLLENNNIQYVHEIDFDESFKYLFQHFLINKQIKALSNINTSLLTIFARVIREEMKKGDGSWKNQLPSNVYQLIKEKRLFGYQQDIK